MTPRESKYYTGQNFPSLLVWIDKYEQAINQEKKGRDDVCCFLFYPTSTKYLQYYKYKKSSTYISL